MEANPRRHDAGAGIANPDGLIQEDMKEQRWSCLVRPYRAMHLDETSQKGMLRNQNTNRQQKRERIAFFEAKNGADDRS